MLFSLSLLFGLALAQCSAQTPPPASQRLNLTALSASNGESTLECWQLDNPFITSNRNGTIGAQELFLGELTNATYTVIPPRFDGGFHPAPKGQFVAITSGLAHISLHTGSDEVYVIGGKYGLIIAADTSDVSVHGHRTVYHSDQVTVSLQLPFRDGKVPKHQVLHHGACLSSELAGF